MYAARLMNDANLHSGSVSEVVKIEKCCVIGRINSDNVTTESSPIIRRPDHTTFKAICLIREVASV